MLNLGVIIYWRVVFINIYFSEVYLRYIFAQLDIIENCSIDDSKYYNSLNFLLSYYYYKNCSYKEIQDLKNHKYVNNLFLDSGAYSAYNQGEEINLHEYLDFINDKGDLFEHITQLDIIGNGERSFDNYIYMKKSLMDNDKLLPVYHLGSNRDMLYRLRDHSLNIGVGGIANVKDKKRVHFLNKIINEIYKENKLHLFGVISFNVLKRFKNYIHSVDSAGYSLKGVFGKIMYLNNDGSLKEFIVSDRREGNKKHIKYQSYNKLDQVCNYWGLDKDKIMEEVEYRRALNLMVSYDYMENLNKLSFENHRQEFLI